MLSSAHVSVTHHGLLIDGSIVMRLFVMHMHWNIKYVCLDMYVCLFKHVYLTSNINVEGMITGTMHLLDAGGGLVSIKPLAAKNLDQSMPFAIFNSLFDV